MLSKSLIQFSVDEWGCVPSLLFDLRPNYSGGFEDNGNLLQRVPCMYRYTHCPHPCSRPPLTHTLAGDTWTHTGKSGSSLFVPSKSLSPVLCKFWWLYGEHNGTLLQEAMPYPCLLHPEPLPLWESTADPYLCRRHTQ